MTNFRSLLVSCPLVVASVALATAPPVFAGDGDLEAPTKVRWPDCANVLRTVDRSVTPIVHIATTFDGEDDVVPPGVTNEPPDSRTHQLFAMCRSRLMLEALPRWITLLDLDGATRLGNVTHVATEWDVLELNPAWQGCYHRINEDDARHPITHQRAWMGFDWDTRDVPPGVYTIEGYTLEPPNNAWASRPHPTTYRIVDARDPDNDPPAAAFADQQTTIYRNRTQMVRLCAAAPLGSRYQIDWAVLPPEGTAPTWTPASAGDVGPATAIDFEFTPPEELVQTEIVSFMLRATVVDHFGRSYQAHSHHELRVLPRDEYASGDWSDEDLEDGGGQGCRTSTTAGPSSSWSSSVSMWLGPWVARRRGTMD